MGLIPRRALWPCIGWYDNLQNLSPINGNSFQRKTKLIATLIFYSSIRFVFQTEFISEQIAEKRFGDLLEISNKFISKFNVFSYIILQFRLKTVSKISKPYCMTLKTVTMYFWLKGHSLYPKSQGWTFRYIKRFEDKT